MSTGALVVGVGVLLVLVIARMLASRATANAGASRDALSLAFVLLREAALPNAGDVIRAFSEFSGGGELRTAGTATAEVLQFEVATGGTAFVALLPLAVPKGEADAAARYSLSAMGTGWSLPPHAAHLIVTLKDMDASSPVERLTCFTSLLAAIVRASPAVGVYWGAARATHDPAFFLAIAENPESAARTALWTGVSVAHEPDGRRSLLSLGMSQLDLPDLLLVAPASSGMEALTTLFDLLNYVIERGKPLPEGDTVGRTETERLPVHYVRSPIDPKRKVWRVEIE